MTQHEHRNLARKDAELGVAYLARTFNICDNPELPYTWTADVKDRFRELVVQIIELVEQGDIKPRMGAAAQDDIQFQRFMGLIAKT